MKQQMELRQKQLQETASVVAMYTDPDSLARLVKAGGKSSLEEMAEYRARLEAEKKAREDAARAERDEREKEMREKMAAEMLALQQQLAEDQRKAEEDFERRKQEVLRQREDLEKKASDEKGALDQQEKDRIIAEFEREREASMAAQDAAKRQRQAKLADRLAAKKAKGKGADSAAGPPPDGAPPDALRAAAAAVAGAGGLSDTGDDDDADAAPAAAGEGGHRGGSRRPSRKASIRNSGDMDGAAKAAAAAAASPALVSSMALIEKKLEKIEEMMLAIERNRGVDSTSAASAASAAASADGTLSAATAAGSVVYHDEAEPSPGHALDIVPDDDLKDQERVRLDFGRRLAGLVGLKDVRVRVAEELPPSTVVNNAFSNSYHFDAARGELLVHRTRVPKAGDFGLVMIHALSHIKVGPTQAAFQAAIEPLSRLHLAHIQPLHIP